MRLIADLHIHSRYSRATSSAMSPEELWKWSQLKGLSIIGTGDFTHPEWLRELSGKLEPAGGGLFALRRDLQPDGVPGSCRAEVRFMLTAEISCIYRKRERTRKVHCLIFVPAFEDARRINAALSLKGTLSSDGRPILGLDARDLLRIAVDASEDALLVPAHAWTPHFSVFGAFSGFDTLEECFEELTPRITAVETGLSSDPPMNWRLSALDRLSLLSNSDAHSPSKIGREATVFDTEPAYRSLKQAIETKKGLTGTIEFFPEEGKYHLDGHRLCGVRLAPEETLKHGQRCPLCGRKVTVGVMHRVEALADRPEGYRPPGAPFFHSLIPLQEVLAEILGVGAATKTVHAEYMKLLSTLGSELSILMERPAAEIEKAGSALLGEALERMRRRQVSISPGFDGQYGTVRILGEAREEPAKGQAAVFG